MTTQSRSPLQAMTAIQQRASRMRAKAEHLAVLARAFEDRAVKDPSPDHMAHEAPARPDISRDHLLQAARDLYAQRRLRDRILGKDLFGEPAWDMLLDLFIQAQKTGEPISTTNLSLASAAPPTTAWRWICELEKAGLIERHAVASDKRKQMQALTGRGLDLMVEYVSRLDLLYPPVLFPGDQAASWAAHTPSHGTVDHPSKAGSISQGGTLRTQRRLRRIEAALAAFSADMQDLQAMLERVDVRVSKPASNQGSSLAMARPSSPDPRDAVPSRPPKTPRKSRAQSVISRLANKRTVASRILFHLLERPGQFIPCQELIEAVGAQNPIPAYSLRVHIYNLREALSNLGGQDIIITGYKSYALSSKAVPWLRKKLSTS